MSVAIATETVTETEIETVSATATATVIETASVDDRDLPRLVDIVAKAETLTLTLRVEATETVNAKIDTLVESVEGTANGTAIEALPAGIFVETMRNDQPGGTENLRKIVDGPAETAEMMLALRGTRLGEAQLLSLNGSRPQT